MREAIKKAIEIHHALYRVTDLLPLREPLRRMLRENANAVLDDIIGEGCGETNRENVEFRIKVSAQLAAMQNTLAGAKELGYCHPVNFDVLEREYKEIGELIMRRQEAWNARGAILDKKKNDFARVFENAAVPIEKKDDVDPADVAERDETTSKNCEQFYNNERQQAIVDFIKERKEVKSAELAAIFSNRFSLKTLQRDLARLIGQKVIDKQGEKRWAVYRMNGYH